MIVKRVVSPTPPVPYLPAPSTIHITMTRVLAPSTNTMRRPVSPMYPKSPIERPARAAVPSRSRSDPHVHGLSPSEPSSSLNTTSEAFPPKHVVPTPIPQDISVPNHLRTSSLFGGRSASSSISHNGNASSSISVHSQSEIDKDTIIARLSTSNAQLEASFVTELSHLSTALSETAESLAELQIDHQHLQDSWAGLNIDFAATRDENVRLREELEHKEDGERENKTRISSLLIERDSLRGRYEAARASAQDRTDEVESLRAQVQGLKRWVSSSGRSEGQVTDSAIRTSVSDLAAGLQNWVLKNFRRSRLKPSTEIEADIREVLDELAPTWESILENGTAKVHLLQSLVSRLLLNQIFGSYFVGLPQGQEEQIRSFETWLSGNAGEEADVNQWRSATLGALDKSSLIEKFARRTEEVVDELAREIMLLLNGITISELPSEQVLSSLKALVTEAISLHRTLRVQKARFGMHMPLIQPHQIEQFDPETMEDIGGEDEEALSGREVMCVTFPGLMKEGDEMGERTELRNCVAKAKVLCVADGD